MAGGHALASDAVGRSAEFSIGQGQAKNLALDGASIRAVAVTNLTPFPIHFPDNPAPFAWVLPNTYGAVIPVAPQGSVRINTRDAIPGITVPSGSALLAQLTVFEQPLPYSPGVPYGQAPALTPNQAPVALIQVILPVAAAFTVVIGLAGQNIYLFTVDITLDALVANSWLSLRQSSGLVFWFAPTAGTLRWNLDFKGAALATAQSLQFVNSGGSAGAIIFSGSVTFSQA